MQRIHNLFWRDVLRRYKRLYTKCSPANVKYFMSECLHYNVNTKRGKRVVYVKEWFDAGIFFVHQLVNAGHFLIFQEFRVQFPTTVNTNLLMYKGIINAIRDYQINCKTELTEHLEVLDTNVWSSIYKGNKSVQSILRWSNVLPAAFSQWDRLCEDLQWENIFIQVFRSTTDTQLRWFQTRLLHRLLPVRRLFFVN